MSKPEERENAINLRKKGYSYRDILQHVPVSKSTLSFWLRGGGLSRRQRQRLTLKKIAAARRGAQAQRNKRLKVTKEIKDKAKNEIAGIDIDTRMFWLMGIMLYWAEGAKEKNHTPSVSVKFSNSDPLMIRFFQRWLVGVCKIPRNHLKYELYIHESNKSRLKLIRHYWADTLGIAEERLDRIYFKKNKVRTKRKNVGMEYYGLIRIVVAKSVALNRKISGWIEGITEIVAG